MNEGQTLPTSQRKVKPEFSDPGMDDTADVSLLTLLEHGPPVARLMAATVVLLGLLIVGLLVWRWVA